MSFCKIALLSIALVGANAPASYAETKTAIFSGGCFWCVEKDFEHVKGVSKVVSGYTGGTSDNPTYKHHTEAQHLEAVEVFYDPDVVSYESLLETYWRTVDPTDAGGQFCDRGHSYTTAIFTANEMEKQLAEKTKAEAAAILKQPIATVIRDAAPFYNAEDYHQDYYKKNPNRYGYYRWACGRNQRVESLWGKEAYKGVSGHES